MSVTGHFYTHDVHAANHLRYALYDYLDHQSFTIDAYATEWGMRGDTWTEYRLRFTNVPYALYQALSNLYTGADAVYPYRVGICAHVVKDHNDT